jgi:serine/threonine-protein kinase
MFSDGRPQLDPQARERLFDEAILAYLDARDAGRAPQREEFLARYPQIRAELCAFLDDEAEVGAALAPCRASDVPQTATAGLISFGHYQVCGVINRGGMGVILRCRDHILNRELAVKVLRTEFAGRPNFIARFQEEAQIASQLQHPGIAPVHELGTLPDGRPYFTMKLIGGRDLAALLRERPSPAHDLPRFLVIFQQVCQAVAYAHSKNVLHRDLKPSNVMVGEFGEVQVMDWGLGKVLTSDGPRLEDAPSQQDAAAGPEPSTVVEVRTLRKGNAEAATEKGHVQGTLAYMPPEQARGEVEQQDRRCDVFSLGAILCEILTGKPPYVGQTRESLWEQAREARVDSAWARLEQSGAAAELVSLAKACLVREPKERLADAGAVAAAVTAYLNGVQEKLRAAEVERARAEAKAAEERNKRRWQLGLAAAVLAAVLAGLGSWRWLARQQEQRRAEATQEATTTLGKARDIHDRVRRMTTDTLADANVALGGWKEGLVTAEAALGLARRTDVDPALRAAAEDLRDECAAGVKEMEGRILQAQREGKFVAALQRAATLSQALLPDAAAPDLSLAIEAYRAAFREYGVDVLALESATAAARLQAESPAIRQQAVEGLDRWRVKDVASRPRLSQIVDGIDNNPWRRRFGRCLDERDVKGLKELARAPAISSRQAELLGNALRQCKEVEDSVELLQRAVFAAPGDFALQMELGNSLMDLGTGKPWEALACLQAAVAIAPANSLAYTNLGFVQKRCGQLTQAEASLRHAMELQPDNVVALCNLASLKLMQLETAEVEKLATQALGIRRGYPVAIAVQAVSCAVSGRVREAKELLAQLPESARDDLDPLFARFAVLCYSGPREEMRTTARRLARLYPHSEFAAGAAVMVALKDGDSKAMETAARAVIGRFPAAFFRDTLGRITLALALTLQGHLTEAEAEARQLLVREGEGFLPGQAALYEILIRQGRFKEAKAVQARLGNFSWGGPLGRLYVKTRALLVDIFAVQEERIENIAAGKQAMPSGMAIDPAFVAALRRKPAIALPLYRQSFQAVPLVAGFPVGIGVEDVMTQRVYAARAAALFAAGQTPDVAGATDAERRSARRDALRWLQTELNNSRSLSQVSASIPRIRTFLLYCQNCPDFTAVRDAAALGKLPQAEREEWQQFWADVDALLKGLDKPAPKKAPARGPTPRRA